MEFGLRYDVGEVSIRGLLRRLLLNPRVSPILGFRPLLNPRGYVLTVG